MSYREQLAQAQAVMAQYINTNQYNAANILGGGTYMGSGSGTYQSYPASGYPTTSTIATYPTQSIQTIGYGNQPNPAPLTLPAPSGQKVAIAFMDARGVAFSIDVDAAYVQLLQAISYQHQYSAANQQQSFQRFDPRAHLAATKMLEGDFSEDEMSQAEQIIQEMNCGSQEPCQCEA